MKLRKIIASATLSVCLATSAVIATTSLNKTGAYAATQNVDTSGIASTVVKSGSNAAVSYGENIDGTGKAFTGLKLTGSSGAKFDLGTIDLSKSYWNGVDMTYGTEKPASGLSAAAKAEMELKDGSETGDYNKFLYDESTENVNGKYYNGSDTYANFIAFAFAPHVNRYNKTPTDSTLNRNYKELENFTVTLTDVNDSSNFMIINSSEQGDNNLNGRNLLVRGNNQKLAGMRKFSSGGPRIYSGLRVKMFDAGSADQIPYELCYKQNWSATSAAERNPALYSPNGSSAAETIAGTWLIRKFAKTSYVDNNVNDTAAWNGFSSSKVNVTVTFNNVRTLTDMNDDSLSNNGITSLIITSLGGYDLTQSTQEIDDGDMSGATINSNNPAEALTTADATLSAPLNGSLFGIASVSGSKVEIYDRNNSLEATVTFTEATAAYRFKKVGTYTLKWFDKGAASAFGESKVNVYDEQVSIADSLIKRMTASGDNDSIAYVSDKKQVDGDKTFSGVRLTGVKDSTFDLGNFKLNNDKLYWNGNVKDDTSAMYTGTNDYNKANGNEKSYGSFLSYVYDPNGKAANKGDLEVHEIIVTLTEVGNERNFVSVKITRQMYDGVYTQELRILARATGNSEYAIERYRAAGTSLKENARKYYVGDGQATTPLDLVWDNEKSTIYTNTSWSDAIDGIGGAWGIRQFGKDASYYAAGDNGQNYYQSGGFSVWNGFTDGATLNCTVKFSEVKTTEPTSIIVTSFGGYDLKEDNIKISHDEDEISYTNRDGSTFDLKGEHQLTVKDDLSLPNVAQYNMFTGNVDYVGNYELIAPDKSTIAASGAYQDNVVIPSSVLRTHGRGVYTLNITDAYDRTETVEYKVGAILSAEISKNATLYLNGKKYTEGDEIIVHDDNVAVRVELNEGYEVEGYKIDDDSCTLINVGGDLYLEANLVNSKNVFRPVVSATKYTISYGFFDSAITDIPESQIFTVETRNDLALAVPNAEGKTFTGWYLNGRKITSGADLKLENVTLTGAFGEKRITVTFVVDGEESYGYKFEGGSLTDYVPQKDGYVFEGWFDEDGNKVNLANVAADVKVYAKFTPAGEIPTGDKETAGVNDGEATVIDAEIKEPYYIGVVELVSFGLAALGLAGTIVGLVLFLKKKKAGATRGITDGAEANADEINEEKGE